MGVDAAGEGGKNSSCARRDMNVYVQFLFFGLWQCHSKFHLCVCTHISCLVNNV